MKKYIILIILFSTAISFGQNKNFIDQPYLETTAKVDTLITPDEIYIKINIREKESKGRKSVEEQENKMARSLTDLGINLKKQLVIEEFSSSFQDYFLRKKQVLKSKQYTLLVYSGKKSAEVFIALEKLDIANMYIEKTAYSKIKDLELLLKSKAVIKAKNKAIALTQPLGQKVGAAIHILDNSTPYYPRYNQRVELKTMAFESDATPEPLDLNFDKIKIETQVNVKFKIE